MASILRQIVAGPRAQHPEAGLDLCYVTDFIVVTSGPSSVWPKKAYRNPLDQVVAFLDRKHGTDWSIFEFRAEGTGYPDSEVYNRIHHFPWPDHHPPPFAIIPNLMAAMRNWIERSEEHEHSLSNERSKRIAVVHCKAGKGRSGTVACSYLISQEGWTKDDALRRFTERRMRSGFGAGVSIPSQLRYIGYVDRWTNHFNKRYVERPVEIVEIHIDGLRDGVKVSVEGFVEDGRKIHHFHTFHRGEKRIMDATGVPRPPRTNASALKHDHHLLSTPLGSPNSSSTNLSHTSSSSGETVVLQPERPIRLPTSDINIDFERRNKASYAGLALVTSIAHVWFNAFFEGGHEGHDSGVFAIEWEAMDGIKGSSQKGIKALDRLKVVWKYAAQEDGGLEQVITQPQKGEPVPENEPPDWRGEDVEDNPEAKHPLSSGRAGGAPLTMGAAVASGVSSLRKELGLRHSDPGSANVSRASSIRDVVQTGNEDARKSSNLDTTDGDFNEEGVKSDVADGVDGEEEVEGKQDNAAGHVFEAGLDKTAHVIAAMKGESTKDGQPHGAR